MFKSLRIKQHERGLLSRWGDFRAVLMPGLHRLLGQGWSVQKYDLSEPEATIPNLEFLLKARPDVLAEHFTVVKTGPAQAALVRLGQGWITVGPNQLRAFWKGFVEVEAQVFDLEAGFELPAEHAKLLKDKSLAGLQMVQVAESQIGLLYDRGNFVRPLEPGTYGFWVYERKITVHTYDRTQPVPNLPLEDVLLERHPGFVAQYCESVQLGAAQVALVRHKGKVIAVLPPASRKLFWKGVEVEVLDTLEHFKLSPALAAELVSGLPEVAHLTLKHLHVREVPAQHVGLLYVDGAFRETLGPGLHAWWVFGRALKTEVLDTRLQTLEVSGQEILTKDKVPLRLNLTAGYKVTDAVAAKAKLADVEGYLYKELQFGLRAAVGTRTLDELLEDKGLIDREVAAYIARKTEGYGLEVDSVGVKDIILPGEIKAILSRVVEAEKAAQANVIRRREETAATRSMLNTAKVMEDNPIALRLKELEVLERISEKIERINVGSLDSILSELVSIKK
ncbi:slipin family protein [Calidithermus chliarophilus]|uniref:slipin family protein n=1 Tax=Calidithermus chliarophilus TaxID=52023 RepID=UPI0003FA53A5|nr:slipin family protein [Calidithermus chliarophilus]